MKNRPIKIVSRAVAMAYTIEQACDMKSQFDLTGSLDRFNGIRKVARFEMYVDCGDKDASKVCEFLIDETKIERYVR